MHINFTWRSDKPDREDLAQFWHLCRANNDDWRVCDQQPLGARLPTRLWYSGMADSETWATPLPADLELGTYSVFTGLYRQRDQERLPVANADGTPFTDAIVPLGSLTIDA